RWRHRGWRLEPALLGDDDRGVRIEYVVRGHNLDAVLVEHVLDVGIEDAPHRGPSELVAEPHPQRVLYVEVREGELQDLRRRLPLQLRRADSRFQQHGVNLAPGNTVAYGHGGFEDGSRGDGGAREIPGDGSEDHGVGYAHLLVGE